MRCLIIIGILLWGIPSATVGEGFLCAGASIATSPADGARAAKSAQVRHEGTRRALVIFAQFADEEPKPVPEWASAIFAPERPGSFSHFYDTMSFGKLQMRGDTGPQRYASRQPASDYLADTPYSPGRFGQFVLEILEQVDAEIDLSRFDSDGPDGIPDSGDDDGLVDAVFVIASSTPANFLMGGATGVGYLGLDDERLEGDPRLEDGEFVSGDMGFAGRPICIPSAQGTIQQENGFAGTMGAMCHEYGHVLGLSDLYNAKVLQTEESRPEEDSAGIGNWGLMGWGTDGWHGLDGPASLCAWSRLRLGWAEVTEIEAESQEIQLEDVGTNGRVVQIPLSGREFFLVEYRRRMDYYNRNIPAEGLLIWHVERTLPTIDQPSRYLVDLECADGKWLDAGFPLGQDADSRDGGDNLDFWAHDLEYARAHGGNLGDATDIFDGVQFREFTPETNPDSRSQDGSRSIWIEEIHLEAGKAFLQVRVAPPIVLVEGIHIDDASGDGLLVAGEEGEVRFQLANRGGLPAKEMWVALHCGDPWVEILQEKARFPGLEIGSKTLGSQPAETGFPRFRFVPGFTGAHTVDLELEVYAGEDRVGGTSLSVEAISPRQIVREVVVIDSLGDGNGMPQAGEFFHLSLALEGESRELLRALRFTLWPLAAQVRQISGLGLIFGTEVDSLSRSTLSPEFLLETGVEEGDKLRFELRVDSGFEMWRDTLFVEVGRGGDRTPPRITLARTWAEDANLVILLADRWILDGSAIETARALLHTVEDSTRIATITLERGEDGFENVWENPAPGSYLLIVEVEDVAGNTGYSQPFEITVTQRLEGDTDFDENAGSWNRLALPANPGEAEVTCIAVAASDPMMWYAATPGALWRSEDSGENWQRTGMMFNGFFSWIQIQVDPRNPLKVYVVDGLQMLKSEDGGKHWQEILPPPNEPGAYLLGIDTARPGRIYGFHGEGLLISEDEGGTWREVELKGMYPRLPVVHPADPEFIYTGDWSKAWSGNFWYSTDGGYTWDSLLLDRVFEDIAPDPGDPAGLYGVAENAVWRSGDRGVTWERIETGTNFELIGVLAHPLHPELVFAWSSGRLLRSQDRGATWSRQILHRWHDTEIVLSPLDPSRVFTTASPHGRSVLLQSRDYGATFEPISWIEDYHPVGTVVFGPNGQPYIGSRRNEDSRSRIPGILTSEDGVSWKWLSTISTFPNNFYIDMLHVDSVRPHIIISHPTGGIGAYAHSEDGGSTWKPVVTEKGRLGYSMGHWFDTRVIPDPYREGVYYTNAQNVWRSIDYGANWKVLGPYDSQNPWSPIDGFALDPNDPSILYAAVSDSLWKSEDAGQSWEMAARVAPGEWILSLETNPGQLSGLYALTQRGVYLSEDRGTTWSLLLRPGAERWFGGKLRFHPRDPTRLFLVTLRQLYQSRDAGFSWEKVETGIAGSPWFNDATVDPFDSLVLYLSTTWGVYRLELNGEAESQVGSLESHPEVFQLNPNYPNPFNGWTMITYRLPKTESAVLSIYNIAGQRVKRLVNAVQSAGEYQIAWDGRDDGGRTLASGVYLYRLQADDGRQVTTRKLLILR